MDLKIIHECPQCGGEVELAETDRVLACPFCGIRHVLAHGTARFILPHIKRQGRLVHVPYLRCKGSVFSCHLSGVAHRVVDTTVAAVSINILPHTLGYRPQAMKMQYASDTLVTTYLKNTLTLDQAITLAEALHQTVAESAPPLHQEWIGETISLIYLPLIIDNDMVFDGVTGDALTKLTNNQDIFKPLALQSLDWQIKLLPTLCPNCGADLCCEQESVVLLCSNCDTAWQESGGKLAAIAFETVAAKGEDAIHLPFWRLEVDFAGIDLHSLADFIRLTNLPRAIKPEWEDIDMAFYCPAFKIRPKIFLRIASQLTAAQLPATGTAQTPSRFASVSLESSEAEESIKLILASAAIAKRNILPKLPEITVTIKSNRLVFLPFFDNGYELCQEEMKVVINKQILELGKKL
jgi:DNA-directed RNA polymerase subunit RPC12/RpoP